MYAEKQEQEAEEYKTAVTEYEAKKKADAQARKQRIGAAAPEPLATFPNIPPVAQAAITRLWNIVHVPTQASVEAILNRAFAP
jgi:hypothetical protein